MLGTRCAVRRSILLSSVNADDGQRRFALLPPAYCRYERSWCSALLEMASHQDRLQVLEARCSGFAVELLRQLQKHPKFPELVTKLEGIQGNLYRTDVEKAFFELTKDSS